MSTIQNKFFSAALQKAVSFLGRPGKMVALVARLFSHMKQVNWSSISAGDIKEKLTVLGRMIKAYAEGQYRDVPMKTILLLLAAVIYFVNPLDFIPDFIPVTGLVDDVAIIVWIFKTVDAEIHKFLTWEKSRLHT